MDTTTTRLPIPPQQYALEIALHGDHAGMFPSAASASANAASAAASWLSNAISLSCGSSSWRLTSVRSGHRSSAHWRTKTLDYTLEQKWDDRTTVRQENETYLHVLLGRVLLEEWLMGNWFEDVVEHEVRGRDKVFFGIWWIVSQVRRLSNGVVSM